MKLDGTEGRDQSEFNMAVSYLNRLNSLFYVANASALELDAFTWFHALTTIFRELSGHMKGTEVDKWKQKRKSINPLITKHLGEIQRKGMREIEEELFSELEDFELFLRRVLKESGLQTRMMDDPAKALR